MTNPNPIRAFRFKRTFFVEPDVPWFDAGEVVLAVSLDWQEYGILPRDIGTPCPATLRRTMALDPFLVRDMVEEITDEATIKAHSQYSGVVDAFRQQAEFCNNRELRLLSEMQELQERLGSARSHSRRIDDIIKSL